MPKACTYYFCFSGIYDEEQKNVSCYFHSVDATLTMIFNTCSIMLLFCCVITIEHIGIDNEYHLTPVGCP